jgi:hypothetical protein
MKAVIASTFLSFAVAASAAAADRVSDVDYLRASRCKGLAAAQGGADTAGLDAFLKDQGRNRLPYIQEQGQAERARGKRDGANAAMKERVAAELSGPCGAYMKPAGASAAG